MSKKKVIGLNADYRTPLQEKPAFSYVAAGYADCIAAAGGIPLIIPPMEEVEDGKTDLDIAVEKRKIKKGDPVEWSEFQR